ncbi:hypothetical protein IU405_13110 [Polaribacter sp. BAL334]|uniref:hypothetical protein n=1 Tax=Polaribacter sp. BAL334 TaxID=1708178 RepID=UPI0018D240B2|nr:hypothetical protein [Polaribacter sp. BAL334]MBG7613187.1 hypothetical protein [Polaribacter sp. BAL334]
MKNKVKSGKEIVDDFFKNIEDIDGVDKDIVKMLTNLYENNKLTEINVKNELPKLRIQDGNKD